MTRIVLVALFTNAFLPLAFSLPQLRPSGSIYRPGWKGRDASGLAHASFFPTIEGGYFRQFQGFLACDATSRLPDGTWWYNRPYRTATPPAGLSVALADLRLPWRHIVAAGPENSNAPLPFLVPISEGDTIQDPELITPVGAVITLQVQVITNLSQLPTTASSGQGTWQLDWGNLNDDFLTLQGRFLLISADIPLSQFAPAGCPSPGCADSGADADLNGDCEVSLNDLAQLLAGFGSPAVSSMAGDVDYDDDVDLSDLAIILSRFGNFCQ